MLWCILIGIHYKEVFIQRVRSRRAKHNQSTKNGTKVLDRQETSLSTKHPVNTMFNAQPSASMHSRTDKTPRINPLTYPKKRSPSKNHELLRDSFSLNSPLR